MANFDEYAKLLHRFEGGFVNDPADRGGATNKGVTIAVYRGFFGASKTVEDLKNMTEAEWRTVMKSYWDRVCGDRIERQGVAEMIADWHINSGVTAIKLCQGALGVEADGKVGPETLKALNSPGAFDLIRERRIRFYHTLVSKNPSQGKFLKGWLGRVDSIKNR